MEDMDSKHEADNRHNELLDWVRSTIVQVLGFTLV